MKIERQSAGLDSQLTLIVESIDPVQICHLVVAAQKEEVVRVLDLVAQHEHDCLQIMGVTHRTFPDFKL